MPVNTLFLDGTVERPALRYADDGKVEFRFTLKHSKGAWQLFVPCCAAGSAAALENSPIQLLSDEVLAQGREARAVRMSPESTRQIRELRRLRETLKSAIDAAMETLHDHDYPRPDPMRAMAASGVVQG